LLTGRNSNSYSHADVRRIEREYIRIPERLVSELFTKPSYMVSAEYYFVGAGPDAGRVSEEMCGNKADDSGLVSSPVE
jgi:hypothetical protein